MAVQSTLLKKGCALISCASVGPAPRRFSGSRVSNYIRHYKITDKLMAPFEVKKRNLLTYLSDIELHLPKWNRKFLLHRHHGTEIVPIAFHRQVLQKPTNPPHDYIFAQVKSYDYHYIQKE